LIEFESRFEFEFQICILAYVLYINERELCRKKISVKHGSGQSAESNNPYHTRFNMQAAQAVHENVSNLKKP